MKILNFGSLNIDYVYHTDHFVAAGETVSSASMDKNTGGKGLNQSVAFAKAGAAVCHAGCIGAEGDFLAEYLASVGADTSHIRHADVPTGHAIIQVDKNGQNCILLYGGANQSITPAFADAVLADFEKGDYLILQNEISSVPYLIRKAHEKGMITVLNPSPITAGLKDYPLSLVDWFIMNEIEGEAITGEKEPSAILAVMRKRYPDARTVLTLGAQGAVYADADRELAVPAGDSKPVDTTAAGDTFTGYFFTAIAAGDPPEDAMRLAARASDITVSRNGAAESIPFRSELD